MRLAAPSCSPNLIQTTKKMNTKDHGKKIRAVYWHDNDCALGNGIDTKDGVEMRLSATYHGDRDEFWIIVERNGKEESRINPRNITQIIWENVETSNPTKGKH